LAVLRALWVYQACTAKPPLFIACKPSFIGITRDRRLRRCPTGT